MDMANFWLVEKQLIHKLFKVLVPRYESTQSAFTRLLKAPRQYPGPKHKKAILELKGNPYPPLKPNNIYNRNLIHNILLDEARKDYRLEKYAEIAAKIDVEASKLPNSETKSTDSEVKAVEEKADVPETK